MTTRRDRRRVPRGLPDPLDLIRASPPGPLIGPGDRPTNPFAAFAKGIEPQIAPIDSPFKADLRGIPPEIAALPPITPEDILRALYIGPGDRPSPPLTYDKRLERDLTFPDVIRGEPVEPMTPSILQPISEAFRPLELLYAVPRTGIPALIRGEIGLKAPSLREIAQRRTPGQESLLDRYEA